MDNLDIKNISEDKIVFYTDGSYRPSINPNASGWAWVSVGESGLAQSGMVENPVSRNIDGELMAVKKAIQYVLDNNINKDVVIVHDYEGCGKWVSGEWRTKKDLTKDYVSFVEKAKLAHSPNSISFSWVKGHSGNIFNERADELAVRAIKKGEL